MQYREYKKMFELEKTHFWFIGKRLSIDAILRNYGKAGKKKILDVGCGTGGTTQFLEQFGTVIGIEKNVYASNCAKLRGIIVKRGSAEHLPFKRETFDMVTLFDVLYHKDIYDVESVLEEVDRVLVSHGKVLITDSAFSWLWSSHDIVMHAKRRFIITDITTLLKQRGYKIHKASYFFFLFFPLLCIKRKFIDVLSNSNRSDVTKLHPLVNEVGIILMKIESFFLKYISYPFGSSLIVYAEKES